MMANAGNKGKEIRSDCWVEMEETSSGGIQLELDSRVKTLYGDDISALVRKGMKQFGIRNARIYMEDSGALPFVLMARLEAAARQLRPQIPAYLPPLPEENKTEAIRERFRLSRLYLPGNTPKMMLNAGIHRPHGIILDLEDSVAPSKKEEARLLVRNALGSLNFFGAERMVRINPFPMGAEDLEEVIPQYVQLVLLPKCEHPEQIEEADRHIERIRKKKGGAGEVLLMPIVESALGVEEAFRLATASEHVVAMAIGLEDYTAGCGTLRSPGGEESFYARTRLVNACKAAGIQAIDSVFPDVGDTEGLVRSIMESKKLGFEGMGCIHPRQVELIHRGYAPEQEEIKKARNIVRAFEDAEAAGLGVVSLGTKMIDPPVVKKALRIIHMAVEMGLLSENWKTEDDEN